MIRMTRTRFGILMTRFGILMTRVGILMTKELGILMTRVGILMVVALVPFSGFTSERYLDYFARDPGTIPAEVQTEWRRVLSSIDRRDYAPAREAMERVAAALTDPTPAIARARLLMDQAIILGINGDQEAALPLIDQGITLIESGLGHFDPALVDLLVIRGLLSFDLRDYAATEAALRRAQHLAHRSDGVYTRTQLPIIDLLREVELAMGNYAHADRETHFILTINEKTFGGNNEALVPVLENAGSFFASQGNRIRCPEPLAPSTQKSAEQASMEQYRTLQFRDSFDAYNRAIDILEDHYGANDLRLVEPLKGLAIARVKHCMMRNAAEAAMERALSIVSTNPAADVADRARATIDLAEVYTINSDKRAASRYQEAWELLGTAPELIATRSALFDSPKRLYPDYGISMLKANMTSAGEGETAFIEIEFAVDTKGRVSMIRVIDGNVNNNVQIEMRSRLKNTIFRPRLVAGQPVIAEGLIMRETFMVQREPEAEPEATPADDTDAE